MTHKLKFNNFQIKIVIAIVLLVFGVVLLMQQDVIRNEAVKTLSDGSSLSITKVKVLQFMFDDAYLRRIVIRGAEVVVGRQ